MSSARWMNSGTCVEPSVCARYISRSIPATSGRGAVVLISRVAIAQDNSVHGEDNFLSRELGGQAFLDAIMDGVTRRAGKRATQLVADTLATARLTAAGDLVALLEELNQHLYHMGGGSFLLTTVSAALFRDGKLTVAGVGDSSVFLVRSNACQPLHSAQGGACLGAAAQLQGFYCRDLVIESGDRLVLATDGITDNLTSSELLETIRHSASADEAVAQLRTIMVTRSAGKELVGAPLQGRFRADDWTAIVRFFSLTGQEDAPEHPGGRDIGM
jgi:stage II sporulation SpoE-like protein